jgi:hypothetical protein
VDRVFKPWIRLFSFFGGMVGIVLVVGWFRLRLGYPITHLLLMPPGTAGWWKVLLPCLEAALVILWVLAAKAALEIFRDRATIRGIVGRLWTERPVVVLLLAPVTVVALALILLTVMPLAVWLGRSPAKRPEPA